MCLDYITKRADEMPAAAIGYKEVIPTCDGRFTPFWRGTSRMYAGLKGGWAVSDEEMSLPYGMYPRTYQCGVHAYAEKKRFPYNGTVKVLLRGPICEGEEQRRRVLVYREMTILEEVHD